MAFKKLWKCEDCEEEIWSIEEPNEWEHDCPSKPRETQDAEDCKGCIYFKKRDESCTLHKFYVSDLIKCTDKKITR